MRLGSLVDLQKAIGFDPGVHEDVLTSAVEAGTQNLIAILETELDRATVVDQFYILPTGSIPLGRDWRTRLALSRGFVDGSVVVQYGSMLTEINMPVSGTSVLVDNQKGAVTITGPDLRNQYITVSYTAGFAEDPDNPGSLLGVPKWLDEVFVMAAMAALDSNNPTIRHDDTAAAAASAKALNAQVMSRVNSNLRYFARATRPIG